VCSAHIRVREATVSICALHHPRYREVPVIRSVLGLRAATGQAAALEAFYAENGVLEHALAFDGCRSALLLRSVDDSPSTHLVIAEWDTAADYRRWVDDPWRAALSGRLAALLDTGGDGPLVGGVFELVAPAVSDCSPSPRSQTGPPSSVREEHQ
jgi:hypothetical protein